MRNIELVRLVYVDYSFFVTMLNELMEFNFQINGPYLPKNGYGTFLVRSMLNHEFLYY